MLLCNCLVPTYSLNLPWYDDDFHVWYSMCHLIVTFEAWNSELISPLPSPTADLETDILNQVRPSKDTSMHVIGISFMLPYIRSIGLYAYGKWEALKLWCIDIVLVCKIVISKLPHWPNLVATWAKTYQQTHCEKILLRWCMLKISKYYTFEQNSLVILHILEYHFLCYVRSHPLVGSPWDNSKQSVITFSGSLLWATQWHLCF